MATIDDRQTDGPQPETVHRGRRPGRVAGTARRRGHLRLSGRGEHADAPGADPLPRPDPDDPAAARAGGHLRGRGLRPRHRQAGRRDGDLRARGAEPRHRPGRRQDGLAADRRHHRPGAHPRHRHRRLPGNADGRGLPGDHQAPLPGAERPRHRPDRQGGVPHRQHRPARPGPDRRAQGHPEHARPEPRLRRGDGPARLPPAAAARRRRRSREVVAAIRASQQADHLLRRRRRRLRTPRRSSASSPPRPASPSP